MLDPKLLRSDLAFCQQQLARRGYELDTDMFNALEDKRKDLQVKTQELQKERNARSRAIGRGQSQG